MTTKQRQLLFGLEKPVPFTEELFDREEEKAARILFSILETRSPRKSDWSRVFSESPEGANYRTIDRALPKLEPKKALMRLYDPESPFVLVDPTEIERRRAKETGYVGRLSDGKTLGFWTIVCSPSRIGAGRSPSTSGSIRRRPSTSGSPAAIWSGASFFGRSRSWWERPPWSSTGSFRPSGG
jgi:hypothetical protein